MVWFYREELRHTRAVSSISMTSSGHSGRATHRQIDASKDLINFADLGLVLEIRSSIKVRNFLVVELVDHFVFARMLEGAQLCANDNFVTGRSA